jgi:U4/U6 small nuclear ribonucleoprotein PRP31
MELDDDEEEVEDAEEEQSAQNEIRCLDDIPDEEETKAKVEKMNLGGVGDVRSVAVLMRALEPVLQVLHLSLALTLSQTSLAFTSLVKQT